ncbi:MAG: hypothetical protein COA32_10155 [Fluviicola sp.]|nr:MAG: hypothetical protein COA32_10155 [Fluviicola sp.]
MDLDIHFFKGGENVLKSETKEDKEPLEKIRDSFGKVLDGKNLSFLLGCGCSSHIVDNNEVGIPTMMQLAKEFYSEVLKEKGSNELKEKLNLDVSADKFKNNLEFFLGTLHSAEFFYENTESSKKEEFELVKNTIQQVKEFLIEKVLNEKKRKEKKDQPINELYEKFYRKLLYRNTNLPKANIFTTNYDLYSEYALDRLGIHYVNGFTGGIKKYFNPTIFNYALAERMDLSQTKWSVIDNFFYLYKIHGSINWIEDREDSKLFQVREIQDATFEKLKDEETIMIHPTPLKQNASLGSPYSDLFREFQKKLMQNNNVLVTIGYSFSDEHINNLIYQAFTIPSFRLIVLGAPTKNSEIEKLKQLNDPRIWIIGGALEDGIKLHYFNGFVESVLPDLSNDDIDDKIENAIKTLLKKNE